MVQRVLLVEDEKNIAEAISFVLRREGWDVKICHDGGGAIDALRAFNPELLVLDHMLPGVSGLDIVKTLRTMPQYADLPVLMLTARGQLRDRDEAERAGVTRFMTKPFSNREVGRAVRDLMHLGQAQRIERQERA